MQIIAIDGIDCVGKETQCNLLKEYLESKGFKVCLKSFPNYNSFTGQLIKDYLSGDYNLDVFTASTIFALNRLETLYNTNLDDYDFVILDRYNTSNIIYQGSRLGSESEFLSYILWLDNLEYNVMKLPKPDKVVILGLDVDVSNKLLEVRGNKYNISNDRFETDFEHRKTLNASLKYICDKLGYSLIDCTDTKLTNNAIKSREEILESIVRVLGI